MSRLAWLFCGFVLALSVPLVQASEPVPPNIVVILADDKYVSHRV